jgi:hypothetical protein
MTTTTDTWKADILRWAQEKLDTMPEGEFGGDWWEAYNEQCDINIWQRDDDDTIRVASYRMYKSPAVGVSHGEWTTDMNDWVEIGTLLPPAYFYYDHSCNECGEPMTGKGDGTRPTRYANGYAHGQCVLDLENFLNKSE